MGTGSNTLGVLNIIYLGLMEYQEALQVQHKVHDAVMNEAAGDTLLLLEHPPVLTLGLKANRANVYLNEEQLRQKGVGVYQVDRGGDVTYHGPGQIVGYPIFNLTRHGRDVHAFMHNMQEVFIRLLEREFGLRAHRESEKYTGIWIGERKITAFGIHIKRWTTTHGFAFNVNTDLSHFCWINPCGLSDRGVTSLKEVTGEKQDMERLTKLVARYFCEVFGMEEHVCALQSLIGS